MVLGGMGVCGVGGTHHDATITYVELWLWVGWVGRVVLTVMLLSHILSCGPGWMGVDGEGVLTMMLLSCMLNCVSGWDGCGWGEWYSP